MTKQFYSNPDYVNGYQIVFNLSRLLTDWFARKSIGDTIILLQYVFTFTKQVHSITDKFVPLQSGSVFLQVRLAEGRTI